NNSCAFDAVISVLYNIWLDDTTLQTTQFRDINDQYLGQVATSFSQSRPQGPYSLEDVHDFIQCHLQRLNPVCFAWGHYTSIQNILDTFLATSHPITSSSMFCPNDHPLYNDERLSSTCQITLLHQCPSMQAFVDDQSIECTSCCPSCQSHLIRKHVFVHAPPIIAFDMSQHRTLLLPSLVLSTVDGQHTTYKLRGVTYHLQDHFTSCFIAETGSVWYHDGLSTGQQMEHEGHV
ncbi:hypothetical protein L208DRAFT_1053752, partial [Tricholoma matsutake]